MRLQSYKKFWIPRVDWLWEFVDLTIWRLFWGTSTGCLYLPDSNLRSCYLRTNLSTIKVHLTSVTYSSFAILHRHFALPCNPYFRTPTTLTPSTMARWRLPSLLPNCGTLHLLFLRILKALANEDTLLRTHCCGHIVADTLLRTHCCGHIVAHDVSWAAQTRKHLLRTQNVSEQNRKHFLRPGHKICVRNKCCSREQTGKHLCRQQIQCVRNNVSSFARAFTTHANSRHVIH